MVVRVMNDFGTDWRRCVAEVERLRAKVEAMEQDWGDDVNRLEAEVERLRVKDEGWRVQYESMTKRAADAEAEAERLRAERDALFRADADDASRGDLQLEVEKLRRNDIAVGLRKLLDESEVEVERLQQRIIELETRPAPAWKTRFEQEKEAFAAEHAEVERLQRESDNNIEAFNRVAEENERLRADNAILREEIADLRGDGFPEEKE